MWRSLLLLLTCRWASAYELLDVEPGLTCSCELANVLSFTAVHARNSSGHWNTEVAIERGVCSIDKSLECSTGALVTTESVKPLADGYEFFPTVGSYYKHHTIVDTWENARIKCEKEGAHLAIINSQEESLILSKIYTHNAPIQHARWDFAFIGFHDIYDEGTYLTIFGEPLSTLGFGRIWNKGEGDFNNLGQNDVDPGQDCGAMHRNGGLNDLNCEIKHSFLCEKEIRPYPPPGVIDYSAGAFYSLQDEIKPPTPKGNRTHPGFGYELFENVGYYKLHTTGTTWENARRICHLEGGHLAIVNSEVEALVLVALFKRVPSIRMVKDNNVAYIGFHDLYTEGQYLTIYDEPLSIQGYPQWSGSNPNNAANSNQHPGQDCGAIGRDGKLDDLYCEYHYAFFCEQELTI